MRGVNSKSCRETRKRSIKSGQGLAAENSRRKEILEGKVSTLSELQKRFLDRVDLAGAYVGGGEKGGFRYGPAFQTLREVFLSTTKSELLCRVALAEEVPVHGYVLYPAPLDGRLQSVGIVLKAAGEVGAYLPFGFEGVEASESLSGRRELYAHLQLIADDKQSETRKITTNFYSSTGEWGGSIAGVVIKRASAAAMKRASQKGVEQWLYESVWKEQAAETTAKNGRWYFAHAGESEAAERLAKTVREQGSEAEALSVTAAGEKKYQRGDVVVYVAKRGLEETTSAGLKRSVEEAVRPLLDLVQRLGQEEVELRW